MKQWIVLIAAMSNSEKNLSAICRLFSSISLGDNSRRLSRQALRSSDLFIAREYRQRGGDHPRFLWGRGVIAALVLGVTCSPLNSSPAVAVLAALVAARSFDSFNILSAVFAFLLGRFFGFGIVLALPHTQNIRLGLKKDRHHPTRLRSIVRAGAPSPFPPSYFSGKQNIS
jgi:hypothetical protein